MSVISADARRPSRPQRSTISIASSRACSSVDMNAPRPVFTSNTIALAPPAIFFDTIEAAISPTLAMVPVRSRRAYKRLVGGHEAFALGRDRAADALDLRAKRFRRERGAHAGDRLELVERAAGVAERAAREFRNRHAAGRDERHDDQRDAIADAAGGVLVDRRPVERDRVARADHGFGQRVRLGRGQPADRRRHQQRRHRRLVDGAVNVAVDQAPPGGGGQRRTGALGVEGLPDPAFGHAAWVCVCAARSPPHAFPGGGCVGTRPSRPHRRPGPGTPAADARPDAVATAVAGREPQPEPEPCPVAEPERQRFAV